MKILMFGAGVINTLYGYAFAQAAMRYLVDGHARGKLVVQIG